MIQLVQVSKTYRPGIRALSNVSVKIERGEFVFLTGPSGAGKTTLLKLLFGQEEPSGGQVLVAGKNVSDLSRRGVAQLRRKLGLVFQEFKLLPGLTALENVALAAQVLGVRTKESRVQATKLLGELGLKEKCEAMPLALSAGEQQRVAIARALVNNPLVLLADEPTGNLDPDLADETMRLFVKIRQLGTTLLIASHNLELIKRYGSRILCLRHGTLADDLRRVERKGPAS